MAKNILITGGAGFIGINSAKRLIEEGCQVTIFDNLSRQGADLNLKWLEKEYPGQFYFIKGDICSDENLLNEEMEKSDAVLHLAAQVAVTLSVDNPRHDFNVNAFGTLKVLEAIRQSAKRPLLIFSSTNKVYGALEQLKIEESHSRYLLPDYPHGISEETPLDFHSPYGCSKGAADQYVRDYARIYSLKTVVLRQSCIYGYRQFGIEDQGWIAWFIIALLAGKPITLYGNGKQVRDILFIDDLTRLYSILIQQDNLIGGRIYNVGGGADNSLSLLEFLDKLRIDFQFNNINYQMKDVRPGDQKVFISDNSRLKRDLGWSPSIGIDEGLNKIIDWTKNNLSIIKSLY